MTALEGRLFAAEPNHQEIDRINPENGRIERVVDVSIEHPVWIGPTSIVSHRDKFVFGTLGEFPIVPGTEDVYKLKPDGDSHSTRADSPM